MQRNKSHNETFVSDVKEILNAARKTVYTSVNTAMVQAYWLIGKRIVEEEQNGKGRAAYGKEIVKTLSAELTLEFGKGFSSTNIKNFRKFYLSFGEISIGQTLSDQSGSALWSQLTWSHFERLIRIENQEARAWYLQEAAEQHWTVRTLDRNIATQYYEQLLKSPKKEEVISEMKSKTMEFQNNTLEFIKSPSVLEFLNLPANTGYTEANLEKAILNDLQNFLLELGKGYAFVERQKLIRTENHDNFIDLVFYNYILKCFILIDLKTERITHQDVGQMDMYVRMFNEKEKSEFDNPTLGIVLCSETDQDIARYSILKGNEQIFATKYKLYLPTEEELRTEIEREKLNLKLQLDKKNR